MNISVNYLSVLLAGVASMVVGFLWYSPFLFGNLWMNLSGLTKEKMEAAKAKGMGKSYFIAFLSSLVVAFVLAHFAKVWNAQGVSGAFALAFWPWLGFVATTEINSILWDNKPVNLYLLNIAHHLVSIFAMALVLVYLP